jgi:hypothetical protein
MGDQCVAITKVLTRLSAADPAAVDPDDVAVHLDAIRATDGYRIPENLYEEIEFMAEATGIWTARRPETAG